eukprot:7388870-Prymnesium_polylepis.1
MHREGNSSPHPQLLRHKRYGTVTARERELARALSLPCTVRNDATIVNRSTIEAPAREAAG